MRQINFLNQNRTFFLNTQWFFQYIMDYDSGFVQTGPLNVLFTVAIFTGYFQDRLNPQLVTVFDFKSQSGGVLPSGVPLSFVVKALQPGTPSSA